MRARRTTLSTSLLAALVAVGAAAGAQVPAAATERSSDLPRWATASAAADGAARTAAARKAATARAGDDARAAEIATVRMAGPNRYATSVAGSKALYTDEVIAQYPLDVVFVASGTNFPDALAATSFVRPFGPLLLVPSSGTVPAVVMNELRRLNPHDIVIVGGAGAVSNAVAAQLATLAAVGRVAGPDRYATAADVAVITDAGYQDPDPEVPQGVDTVYVVNGDAFPDALAAGSATGWRRGAVVLTKAGSLPSSSADAIDAIDPERVVVVGGTGSVSAGVVTTIKALVPGKEVVRRSGADRYGTAAKVSELEFIHPNNGIVLASGLTFPDALSAAAFGAVVDYALLLSRPTCAPSATVAEVENYMQYISYPLEVVGFGGEAVLSEAALDVVPC
ncbi:cell wall-binding repeat-containing protein [Oryzobacter sp. R7]|uniref:cell wall-binding repeat-containing protein n=1 Tax=Oryzobacter faecalis TaxID=3388656 RepID=UPI00398D203B